MPVILGFNVLMRCEQAVIDYHHKYELMEPEYMNTRQLLTHNDVRRKNTERLFLLDDYDH